MQQQTRWEDLLHTPAAFQATALFLWEPKEEGELRFLAGDVIDILDYEGEWWIGRMGQEIGEVPYNFLTYEGAEQQYYPQGPAEVAAVHAAVEEPQAASAAEAAEQFPTTGEPEQQTQEQHPQQQPQQQQPLVQPSPPSRPASGRPRSNSRHLRSQMADSALAPEVVQTLTHIVNERLLSELRTRDSMLETMKQTVQQLESRLLEQNREWRRFRKHQLALPPMNSKPLLGISSLSDSSLTIHRPRRLRAISGTNTTSSKIPIRRAYTKSRNHLPPVTRALSDGLSHVLELESAEHATVELAAAATRNGVSEQYLASTSAAAQATTTTTTATTVATATTSSSSSNDGSLPQQTLRLQYAYGYHGERPSPGNSLTGTNVKWLPSGEIIFPAAAVVVIFDHRSNTQRFFLGHDNEVAAISVCPGSSIVASSELSARDVNGKICIYDTAADDPVRGDSVTLLHVLAFPPTKGAALLDFSPDGELLVAFGQDDAHTVVVYDWKAEAIVAEVRTQNLDVYSAMFHPFQWRPATDYLPAMYTLVSCGSRHMRFWTISQVQESEHPPTKRASPGRTPAKTSSRTWQVEHATASLGKHADVRDITCACCVKDCERDDENGMPAAGRVITGTSSGWLCVWTQLAEYASSEDAEDEQQQQQQKQRPRFARWQARGKLTSIIKDVHEGGVLDVAYLDSQHLLGTAGKDGAVSVWRFEPSSAAADARRNPLSLLFSTQLSASAPTIGPARSIAWDLAGSALVLGTAGSAVCLLSIQVDQQGELGGALGVRMLLRGHSNKIRAIAAHPFRPLFVTVSSDRTLRLWDATRCRLVSLTRLSDKCTAVAMTPDGAAVAIGTEEGEVFVLTTSVLQQDEHTGAAADHKSQLQAAWQVLMRKTLKSKQQSHQESNARLSMQTGEELSPSKPSQGSAPEVTCLQYSPDGKRLAVGCRDNAIYLLAVDNHYKRTSTCRGHTGTVVRLDFSADGLCLRSCDQARELLYWHVPTAKQMTNSGQMKAVEWATWTCPSGRNGGQHAASASDLGAVCRSDDKMLLATSERARIKLSRFGCSGKCEQREFRGHSSSVQGMAFLAAGDNLLTAGGLDGTILQWRVVDAST